MLYFYTPSHAQKMKFSIKDFFSKCDHIRSLLRNWSHLLKKSLKENFIFCAVLKLQRPILFFFLAKIPVFRKQKANAIKK